MKTSLLAKLLFVTIAATNLSGCIIWPDWDHGHHHGHHHGSHHGDHDDNGDHGGRGKH